MNRRRGTFLFSLRRVAADRRRCLFGCSGTGVFPDTWVAVERTPRIRPDYVDTVIPPNIAPLNFAVQEPGVAYRVRLHAANSEDIDIASTSPSIIIPQCAWRTLLEENRGGRLGMDVYVQQPSGSWSRFATIENVIAREDIDSHLVVPIAGGRVRQLGPHRHLSARLAVVRRTADLAQCVVRERLRKLPCLLRRPSGKLLAARPPAQQEAVCRRHDRGSRRTGASDCVAVQGGSDAADLYCLASQRPFGCRFAHPLGAVHARRRQRSPGSL